MDVNAIEQEARRILGLLNMEQKIALVHGVGGMSFGKIPELGLPEVFCADGPQSIRLEDGRHCTSFPCGMALAATWNRKTAELFGASLAREARALGIQVSLGPGLNLMRTPLNGRNFEYYGEDPVLAGNIASGYVKGCQEQGVAATPKHLALNNQEICRCVCDSRCDERTLRELYLQSFEIIIRNAKPWAMMSSYNKINGTWASACRRVQQEFAKDECGFDGVMMSDWGGTHSAKEALRGGLDLEMGGSPWNYMNRQLPGELEKHEINEHELDDHALRVIRLVLRVKEAAERIPAGKIDEVKNANKKVTADIAAESCVLLKNKDHFLPLDHGKYKKILVCGPSANFCHNIGSLLFCGGSGAAHPDYEVTVKDAAMQKWGGKSQIVYAPGIEFTEARVFPDSWIISGTSDCYASEQAYKEHQAPLCSFPRKSLQILWDSEAVAQGGNSELLKLEGPFWERITIRFRAGFTGKLRMRTRVTRQFHSTDIAISGKKLAISPIGSVEPFSVESGKEYEMIFTIQWSSKNGGIQNVLLENEDPALAEEALKLAKEADCVIYVGGSNHSYDKEAIGHGDVPGADIPTYELCDKQSDFIAALAKANPNVAVALISGTPLRIEKWVDQVSAVLECWYPGQETGNVICDLLDGTRDPQGRLPFTWAKELNDYACHGNGSYPGVRSNDENAAYVNYVEGIYMGYRHFDRDKIVPRFPFGYGLSYTSFEAEGCGVEQNGKAADPGLKVKISGKIRNTGRRAGAGVVQVYVGQISGAKADRPVKALRAFDKFMLNAGSETDFVFELSFRDFARYDETLHKFVADPGTYRIQLAENAEKIFAEYEVIL